LAKLELDAANKGWRCSECGLPFDALGRPIFGHEAWSVVPHTNSWLENKPEIKYCPSCGAPIKERDSDG